MHNCARLHDMTDTSHIGSREAASIVGVTQTTINRWVKDGRLTPVVEFPGYRGARLFARADIAKLTKDGER
jgi:predicted site-specific integrase-resolvase